MHWKLLFILFKTFFKNFISLVYVYLSQMLLNHELLFSTKFYRSRRKKLYSLAFILYSFCRIICIKYSSIINVISHGSIAPSWQGMISIILPNNAYTYDSSSSCFLNENLFKKCWIGYCKLDRPQWLDRATLWTSNRLTNFNILKFIIGSDAWGNKTNDIYYYSSRNLEVISFNLFYSMGLRSQVSIFSSISKLVCYWGRYQISLEPYTKQMCRRAAILAAIIWPLTPIIQ